MPKKQLPNSLLKAIALNPKTKRPIRSPKGKNIVYGFLKGKKVIAFPMDPQRFAKTDLQNLQRIINKNELVEPKSFTIFQKPTLKNEVYKKRTPIKIKVRKESTGEYVLKTIYKKKGETAYKYKDGKKIEPKKVLKTVFSPPRFRVVKKKKAPPKYREAIFNFKKGKFNLQIKNWRLQEHSKFDRAKDQIIAEYIPATKQETMGGDMGYKTSLTVMRGKTLSQTLSSMAPKESYQFLKNKNFRAIGATITGIIENKPLGPIILPAIPLEGYADILNDISKAVRSELLTQGKTFTKLKSFEDIRQELRENHPDNKEFASKWKAVNTVQAGGRFHDMQTQINKAKRGENTIKEIKRGDLKLEVMYSYYK